MKKIDLDQIIQKKLTKYLKQPITALYVKHTPSAIIIYADNNYYQFKKKEKKYKNKLKHERLTKWVITSQVKLNFVRFDSNSKLVSFGF